MIGRMWRHWHFKRAVRGISLENPPSRQFLERLRYGWGSVAAAHVEFLDAVVQYARASRGPILECGSGLTTILLSTFAAKRGVDVWSIEHLPQWLAAVSPYVEGVNLRLCPLRHYGDVQWYTLPNDLPRGFSLVICDGPWTGRHALLPVASDNLATSAIILLDDAHTKDGQDAIAKWGREYEMCEKFAIVKPCTHR